MEQMFVAQHIEELTEALTELEELMNDDYQTLVSRAFCGVAELNEGIQFCLQHTDDVCQIPFNSGHTTQMIYDYRTFLCKSEKLSKIYSIYNHNC